MKLFSEKTEDAFPGWSHTSHRERQTLSKNCSWFMISLLQPLSACLLLVSGMASSSLSGLSAHVGTGLVPLWILTPSCQLQPASSQDKSRSSKLASLDFKV
ncbi:hypothetical protein CRENBAI_004752 [Crenichthys baileyi]|uniref:Uncharacterized protein n=1 Tax=Crenichthys baileyi TaxID=28760 RepID=A0AAV9RVR5_9TELE